MMKYIFIFILAVLLPIHLSFAADIEKECALLQLEGSDWFCYMGQSPDHNSTDGLEPYNGIYPDDSDPVTPVGFQTSNTKFEAGGYGVDENTAVWYRFVDFDGDEDWIYQFTCIAGTCSEGEVPTAGIYPSFPDGQTSVTTMALFTGSYRYTETDGFPNKIVFHITNVTDTEDFDVVKNIITDIDSIWGAGLECNNCPTANTLQTYTYQIILEAEKEYTYTVELMEDTDSLYVSDEFDFETGNLSSIDDPTQFLNNGLTCDNCTPLENAPFLMQNFFPFNVIWQVKSAITTGVESALSEDSDIGEVTMDFAGSEITVFTMANAEDIVNGEDTEGSPVSDFIKTIVSAGLYLAFGIMVYSSASGIIKSMTA